MKKQIRAIAAVAAATMLLTGCAAHQQNSASEQTPTTQTQSSTASSVSTETTPAGENWSLLDHLPEWAEGTVTPAVTTDPNSGIPFGENPLNDDDWTKSLSLDGAPMYNGLCVAMDRIYKKSQELGGNCTPIIFVLTDGDSNTGYKFSETKDIIAGMNIPIYTISYNYAADSLSELASINEAASIVGNSEDITYKLRNLFNAEM